MDTARVDKPGPAVLTTAIALAHGRRQAGALRPLNASQAAPPRETTRTYTARHTGQHGPRRTPTPQFSDSIDIARPPADVWRLLATPERWFDGYVETRTRSPDYPGPDTRNDHVYHTRANEHVRATVIRSEAPSVLEEHQEGTTFVRDLQYTLTPSAMGTSLQVHDDIRFKGLAKLAAPIATRDIKKRWTTSLRTLKVTAETG